MVWLMQVKVNGKTKIVCLKIPKQERKVWQSPERRLNLNPKVTVCRVDPL